MRPVSPLPIPAKRALRKLGQDIRDARKRRRIPMELMAERARISRSTLTKVEKGDESVALGIYASVLFALGLVEGLGNLADPATDAVGRSIEERNLPVRVRLTGARSKKAPPKASTGGSDD
ncbi:XRE family transcriptional regulator [Bosea sp. Root483D1]|uniref:helix-turn-helix domain-containing protein n=1 Tax=Bosea sp. Root483D1 TaxID=1736544 RepID=UPI00070E42EC|nr:helix-turn-helix domain-containing protein [Bosea sp. Root483D1]KRE11454.1 XRE family transcriptional regulator [Bosea sp. Root483D1]